MTRCEFFFILGLQQRFLRIEISKTKNPTEGALMQKAQLLVSIFSLTALAACGQGEAERKALDAGIATGISPPSCTAQQDAPAAMMSMQRMTDQGNHQRFIVKVAKQAGVLSHKRMSALKVMSAFEREAKVEALNSDYISVEFNQGVTTTDAGRRLAPEDYEYIEPDYPLTRTFVPNDPSSNIQWAHKTVASQQAWDLSRGSSSVVVAVLDSGIDYTHPDLAANMWKNPKESADGVDNDGDGLVDDIYGYDFYNNDSDPMSDDAPSFHGTHVAGTIGAVGNNGIGITGHAPEVRLMALKFLGSTGGGATSGAIRAIDFAIAHGAKIISNSWGGTAYSQALSDAIDRARAAGILFVVAAGNSGANNDKASFYPANYPQDNIVRVAATNSSDALTPWSNYGKIVDLAAPGENIYSTKNGGTYQSLSGTSMATPLVSGVLATMLAARPDLPYWQQKYALLQGVDQIASMNGKIGSGGRINAYRAVANAMSLAPSNPGSPAPPKCN